jgi:outer membrane receptor for ferrienterochelin and colicins
MKKYKWKTYAMMYVFCICNINVYAQNTIRAIVTDSLTHEKLAGVVIVLHGTTTSAESDSIGNAYLSGLPDGIQAIDVSYIGYQKKSVTIQMPQMNGQSIKINLLQDQSELEEVLVTSNRTNSRIEDAPIKVEVLGIEELNDESSINPDNIASLVGDVSGVQIQQTSAISGNSVVRLQGLDGRYTLLLRDGMPSYSGLSTGLNILQIPPLDLRQIEIVKGPASTINGGGAISGLINFITKEPTDTPEATFLLNQTSLLETNLNTYMSGKKDKIGYTLFAGGTYQKAMDVNGDGFSDVPQTLSFSIHPQLFFYPDRYTHVRIGFIGDYESRLGGDMRVIRGLADSTHQYFEKTNMQNYGTDVVISHDFANKQGIYFKASGNYFDRSLTTNYAEQAGYQGTGYSELYYQIPYGRHNFIIGGNYLLDIFHRSPGDTSSYQNYSYHTGGLFAQYSYNVENKLNFQVGIRGDYQNKFGFFVLPSAAILIHATKDFSVRINGGTGYKIPTIVEILGLEDGINTIPATTTLSPERSYGGTAEWNYKKYFDKTGINLFINQTFFYTWVQHAIITTQDSLGNYSITNVASGATSLGVDNYVRIKKGPVEVYMGYTFVYPRKDYDHAQPYLTLTPLHRGATVVSYDISAHWKIGVEGSLVGKQYLDYGNPTKPYFLLSSSVHYTVKKVTLVLNGENLLNVRQSHYGPVVEAPFNRPRFAEIWAPEEGVVVNFSILVRIK